MRVILDTCVLSEIRHPQGKKSVKDAVDTLPDEDLFVSVITVGEIVKGISLLEDSKRKQELLSWIQALEIHYSERILNIDLETTHIWGEITAKSQKAGKIVSASDGLIAATALRHGIHLMTRNITDFEPTGVMLLDPWT